MSDFKNNNSTEFKAMGSLADGYTVIPNPVMNDIVNMGSDAFTILAKIFQYINNSDHKISVRGLSTQTKLTKDRVSRGLNKLIELGYIVREPKKRGNLTIGYSYLVYDRPVGNTTLRRSPEIQDTEIQDTEFTDTKKENNNKYNIKNKNKDDDDASKLIELYKTFKLEKRVMPHTLKLLKQNTHISLDVFEQIFINASEDGVVKKYSYIKSIVEDLNSNNVTTLSNFEKYNDNFKKSKTKKTSKGSSSSKNKFHNTNSTFDKYNPRDLEKILMESQKHKFPKPNKPEFHNFNEIDKSNGNSEEWGC